MVQLVLWEVVGRVIRLFQGLYYLNDHLEYLLVLLPFLQFSEENSIVKTDRRIGLLHVNVANFLFEEALRRAPRILVRDVYVQLILLPFIGTALGSFYHKGNLLNVSEIVEEGVVQASQNFFSIFCFYEPEGRALAAPPCITTLFLFLSIPLQLAQLLVVVLLKNVDGLKLLVLPQQSVEVPDKSEFDF